MLFNATGGTTLVSPDAAVLNISDDDSGSSTINPIDDARNFVRQQYHDFLNREPDESGLNFWVNQIESCGADPQCREVKRINVSAAFFLSIEFQETGYFAFRLYRFYFAQAWPIWREFMRDVQEVGRGVVVGAPGWQELRVPLDELQIAQGVLLPLGYPGRWNYWSSPAKGRGAPRDGPHLATVEHVQISFRPSLAGPKSAEPGPDAWADIASITLALE